MMTIERKPPRVFNGRYTIESTKTGEHRTFWAKTQPDDAGFAPGKRILSLLSGPENDDPSSYKGFAFVDEDGIHVWSRMRAEGLWEQYAEMLWSLAVDGAFSEWADRGYRLLVEKRCMKCGRPLTTPESVRLGIGPICSERGI
jgi:hypothetical protein